MSDLADFLPTGSGSSFIEEVITIDNATGIVDIDLSKPVLYEITQTGNLTLNIVTEVDSRNQSFIILNRILGFDLEYTGANFVDLSGLIEQRISASFFIGEQETQPRGLAFNPDGTKMFLIGTLNDNVYQYTLSTGFDLSTASYDSVSFSVAGQEGTPFGIAFNNDGTKMFMVGTSSDRVHQYTLTTGFDLSTASYDNVSFSVLPQDGSPTSVRFNTDGTKMFVLGFSNSSIFQYTLTTGFDLTTASYDNISFSVSNQETNPFSLTFNPAGTKMFLSGNINDTLYQYTLLNSFDITTASYDNVSFNVSSEETTLTVTTLSNDGKKIYITGDVNQTIYQYNLVTPFDISVLGSTTLQSATVNGTYVNISVDKNI